MKSTISLDEAFKSCVRKPKSAQKLSTFRDSKFATFLQDGHMVTGVMAAIWRTGDGQKYGWKSDASMLGDACHYGFRMIHVK